MATPPFDNEGVQASAPGFDSPGYALTDDSDGRFVIDAETGIISVVDEAVASADHGRTFAATLRCREPSGVVYSQTLQLRITGRVPQILGDPANEALATLAAGSLWDDTPIVPAKRRVAMAFGAASAKAEAAATRSNWSRFAAFHGHAARRPLQADGAYGTLVGADLPAVEVDATLSLPSAIPAPASADASWPV